MSSVPWTRMANLATQLHPDSYFKTIQSQARFCHRLFRHSGPFNLRRDHSPKYIDYKTQTWCVCPAWTVTELSTRFRSKPTSIKPIPVNNLNTLTLLMISTKKGTTVSCIVWKSVAVGSLQMKMKNVWVQYSRSGLWRRSSAIWH